MFSDNVTKIALNTETDYRFTVIDYIVFLGMILVSTGTGVYFAVVKDKPVKRESIDETQRPPLADTDNIDFGSEKMGEYLLGSRKLKVFPVAMSLIASYVSGVTILGTASEIYNYGTQYMVIAISICLEGLVVALVYIPVFMKLRVGSSYEYLEKRFTPSIRSIASFLFVMDELLFVPFVIYVPALALNQVTGINMHIITSLIVVICVFYTLVGGIKAVVHTDAWQVLVMFLSILVIAILGTYYGGGLSHILKVANDGRRIEFADTTPNMYKRHTLHSVLVGGFFYWTSFNAVNQTMVQRYVSLPTLKKAWFSMAVFTVGVCFFVMLCCYVGLLVYEKYAQCDPLTDGLIDHDDQLLPLYVVQSVGHIYGMPGLFVAGVFGAALSSLSVILNSTALVVLEDIVRGTFGKNPTERASTIIVKSTIFLIGAAGFSLVFVLEKLNGILSIATSMTAIAAASTFSLFTLGMLIPWSNTFGTAMGGIASALICGWISFGTQIANAAGQLNSQKLDVSVDGCAGNTTLPEIMPVDEEQVFPLYRLSYHWINPIGIMTAVIIGSLVSCFKPTNMKTLNPDLISPIIHRFLPKECFEGRENPSRKALMS